MTLLLLLCIGLGFDFDVHYNRSQISLSLQTECSSKWAKRERRPVSRCRSSTNAIKLEQPSGGCSLLRTGTEARRAAPRVLLSTGLSSQRHASSAQHLRADMVSVGLDYTSESTTETMTIQADRVMVTVLSLTFVLAGVGALSLLELFPPLELLGDLP